MLGDSISSSSMDNPLPVDDNSVEFEIMLHIITGRPQGVVSRVETWELARILYDLADKYQLDAHRPWFSQICRNHASQEPWEAIFLSTNHSPMDQLLVRSAITDGFKKHGIDGLFNPAYFKEIKYDPAGNKCWSTFRASNTTIAFGTRLGLSGLMAYNLTFGTIKNPSGMAQHGTNRKCINKWHLWADEFVQNIRDIESQRLSSADCTQTCIEGMEDGNDESVLLPNDGTGGLLNVSGTALSTTCKTFGCSLGNIVIKTIDNVVLRIQDYHLQAAG